MYINFSYASISGYSLSLSGKISDNKTRVLLLPHSFIFSNNSYKKINNNIQIQDHTNICFHFFLIKKKLVVNTCRLLVPAEPSLTLAFPGFLAPLHIFCLGRPFQWHFFVLNASYQCHNTLWRRLCCMGHIFEYKNPVKNFKVTQKTVYNGHKDFFTTNYWGVFINKISIFGSLFHRVWVYLVHEHALLYQFIILSC